MNHFPHRGLLTIYSCGDSLELSISLIIPSLPQFWTCSLVPRFRITKVLWEYPLAGWIKYNTDGASRGNPGPSSYAFSARDSNGDLLYAEGERMEETNNTVSEAKAILEACKHSNKNQYQRIIIQTDSMLLWTGGSLVVVTGVFSGEDKSFPMGF